LLSLHTRITLMTTGVLLLAGTVYVTANEWANPATLGPIGVAGKLLVGFTQAVMPRTAGFNSVNIAEMDPSTWLGIDALMFIGGGSASTAGGIKVTTFALLFFVIVAEIRGERHVNVFDRRLGPGTQRTALTVALLSVAVVVASTVFLVRITDFTLDQVLLEVISAFSTVGLSTGVTAQLPTAGHIALILLMFIGRLGPITLASSLALRERDLFYALPEARPIIG
jgi:Trk-type K+ transport system membrane component